jgi:ABC-type transport system involved in cytochrome bd biosynthesis fused ATPase/permease subunit
LKELKIFDADERQHEKMDQSAEEFRRITMKVLVMQLASVTIMDLVAYGGAGIGIGISVYDAAAGRIMPLTGLFLVLTAVEFFLPLRAFGSAFHVAMNGVSAGKKILSLLEKEEPEWGSEKIHDVNVDLQNVQFSYDGNKEVLQDINLHYPSCGLYAIVGRSGCGKSTIVSLLLGSIRPQSGTVDIGGRPLVSYDRHDYYAHLCFVSSSTFVFHDSIRCNFQMVKPDITDEEILAALKRVNLLELASDEKGLDHVIAEDAQNISGGQKQRLALAVNLTVPKDIYIFDEATSNIDVESEAIIMRVIHEIAR